MFEDMILRLKNEMTADGIEYLRARDGDEPMCVMCLCHVPANGTRATPIAANVYHHIQERGMGGGNPNDVTNLAPACHIHHQEPLHSYSQLWMHAMIAQAKAGYEDYEEEIESCEEYAPIMECFGEFGYGTKQFDYGIPDVLKQIYIGKVDARIEDWCVAACPLAVACLQKARANLLATIGKDK